MNKLKSSQILKVVKKVLHKIFNRQILYEGKERLKLQSEVCQKDRRFELRLRRTAKELPIEIRTKSMGSSRT